MIKWKNKGLYVNYKGFVKGELRYSIMRTTTNGYALLDLDKEHRDDFCIKLFENNILEIYTEEEVINILKNTAEINQRKEKIEVIIND